MRLKPVGLLLALTLMSCVAGEDVVVTVQSLSQEDMDTMTDAIDAVSGPSRVTLGAIEATMSRVIDSETAYSSTTPPSLPSLTMLQTISFDDATQIWSLEYSSMRGAEGNLNNYDRILYFSKNTFFLPSNQPLFITLLFGIDRHV